MRLDALQALFLNIKLKNYEALIKKRIQNVNFYKKNLCKDVIFPKIKKNERSVYQTFINKVKNRDKLISFLKKNGVETKVHYPIPIHKKKSFIKTNKKIKLPITEKLSKKIITLPAMEYVSKNQSKKVCKLINTFSAVLISNPASTSSNIIICLSSFNIRYKLLANINFLD